MSRTITTVTLTVSLVTAFGAGAVYARGFGGGFRGGGFAAGGFRGGYGGGFGGYHASYGGYRGGFGGGGYGGYHASGGFEAARGGYGGYHASGGFEAARGGYGGEAFRGGYSGAAFGRTPSFSSAGTFERSGGEFRGYNPYAGGSMSRGGEYAQGAGGGRYGAGYTSGSYTTQRGGTIDYGAAGRAAVGPGGGAAARGVGGVQVTTAGGRTFTDVGRAGGAVGPGGNAVAGRSNVAAASGPRGTAVEGSRGVAAAGPGGVAAAGERGGAAVGRSGAVGYRSTYGAAASGGYGAAGYHYGAAGYHYGATGYRPYGYNAYGAYHAGWVHGYWNGQNSAAWGWRGPYWGAWGLAAAGLGWGLSNWGFGSALYGMGYLPYANPYYGGAGGGTAAVAAPYDYAQPIDTVSAPAPEDVTSQAVASFDAAREAFHQGDYAQALQQADAALAQTPNDTALHEFRALCLFALGRYDEAAAVLYAVLSVGPGWDWSTLIGLYPDVGTYTAQLRALEAACAANPQSAADRFVLAYHYLTQGHTDAAVRFLKQVVALKPDDSLSARLLKQLAPPPSAVAAAPAPATAADTTPPPGASLTGTWTARPAADTTVTLGLQPDGHFTWGVTKGGKTQQFTGTSTFGDGLLTLAQDNGPVLVGRVIWAGPSHMTFRIAGDGPEDPGLSFAR